MIQLFARFRCNWICLQEEWERFSQCVPVKLFSETQKNTGSTHKTNYIQRRSESYSARHQTNNAFCFYSSFFVFLFHVVVVVVVVLFNKFLVHKNTFILTQIQLIFSFTFFCAPQDARLFNTNKNKTNQLLISAHWINLTVNYRFYYQLITIGATYSLLHIAPHTSSAASHSHQTRMSHGAHYGYYHYSTILSSYTATPTCLELVRPHTFHRKWNPNSLVMLAAAVRSRYHTFTIK